MGLETGTYLDDLVVSNPIGASDLRSKGDDHLRLIKTVLKNSFPDVDQPVSTIIFSATEPPLLRKGTLWGDETANLLKLRNKGDTAWITLALSMITSNSVDINAGTIDGTPIGATTPSTGAFSTLTSSGQATLDSLIVTKQARLNMANTLAAAATVDLGTLLGNSVVISGTTAITAFGTIQAGVVFKIIANGAFTITHNAASLICLSGASIVAAIGDVFEMVSLGSGNWIMTSYQRASGTALLEISENRYQQTLIFNSNTAVFVDTDLAMLHIPWTKTLTSVHAEVFTAGVTGLTTIDVNLNGVSMLTTKLTIDSGETGSHTAGTAAVIDAGNADVVPNDRITIDVDGIPVTAPLGLNITLEFL